MIVERLNTYPQVQAIGDKSQAQTLCEITFPQVMERMAEIRLILLKWIMIQKQRRYRSMSSDSHHNARLRLKDSKIVLQMASPHRGGFPLLASNFCVPRGKAGYLQATVRYASRGTFDTRTEMLSIPQTKEVLEGVCLMIGVREKAAHTAIRGFPGGCFFRCDLSPSRPRMNLSTVKPAQKSPFLMSCFEQFGVHGY